MPDDEADGDTRDFDGASRDDAADQRDAAADARDAAADARDAAADARDRAWLDDGHPRSSAAGLFAEASRRDAAASRAESSLDRRAGAAERSSAERDRTASSDDRSAGASDRRDAAVDTLTGAYARGAGLMELSREMARAQRLGQPLAVAFIDVDHLKIVNDSRGHAAGDQLLIRVVRTIRSKMRAYDLLVRYGGDEFVCVLSGLEATEVAARFEFVHSELSGHVDAASVTVGFAELLSDDSAETLLSRADEMLYRQRRIERNTLPG